MNAGIFLKSVEQARRVVGRLLICSHRHQPLGKIDGVGFIPMQGNAIDQPTARLKYANQIQPVIRRTQAQIQRQMDCQRLRHRRLAFLRELWPIAASGQTDLLRLAARIIANPQPRHGCRNPTHNNRILCGQDRISPQLAERLGKARNITERKIPIASLQISLQNRLGAGLVRQPIGQPVQCQRALRPLAAPWPAETAPESPVGQGD